jgi:hypothetical protein
VTTEQDTVAVEKVIALHTVTRSIYVAPVMILIFALVGGWRGAWSSALGIVVVVANFVLAGVILSISARISLQAYHAAALFGFLLRLGLFVGAVALIALMVDVDRVAFGVSAVVSYLALLVLEAVAVSRGEERELTWTK